MSGKRNYNEYDDASLFPIFLWFKDIVSLFFKKIGFFVSAAFKNYYLTGGFVLLGLVLAFANYKYAKKVYHSSAVFTSKILKNEISERFIDDLHYLSSEKNYEEISEFLNISLEEAQQVKDIYYSDFREVEEDSTIGDAFIINALVYNIEVLEKLEIGIFGYLENNSYAVKNKNAKENTLKELSLKIDSDVRQLDSLKNDIREGVVFMKDKKSVSKKSSIVEDNQLDMTYLNPVDELYSKSVSLFEEGLLKKEELALLSSYDILQSFTKFRKPYYPRLLRDSLVVGGLFFILACIISGIRERKSIVKSSRKENVYKDSFESTYLDVN